MSQSMSSSQARKRRRTTGWQKTPALSCSRTPIQRRENRPAAILLLGCTGSGKSPLGQFLEKRGMWNRKCFHFDFGSELRRLAAASGKTAVLEPRELKTVIRVVRSGALLENRHWPIASKILMSFIAHRKAGPDDLIILNGLPRHTGQADNIAGLLDMRMIVRLQCTPATALERILLNSGGDRKGRRDDNPDAVTRRLKLFEKRTLPLIEYYRTRGVLVRTVRIDIFTSGEEIAAIIQSGFCTHSVQNPQTSKN